MRIFFGLLNGSKRGSDRSTSRHDSYSRHPVFFMLGRVLCCVEKKGAAVRPAAWSPRSIQQYSTVLRDSVFLYERCYLAASAVVVIGTTGVFWLDACWPISASAPGWYASLRALRYCCNCNCSSAAFCHKCTVLHRRVSEWAHDPRQRQSAFSQSTAISRRLGVG